MVSNTPASTGPASPQDPPRDPTARTLPHNLTVLLHAVRVLLGYGRHLMDTVCLAVEAPSFNAIAARFGTSHLHAIILHLHRGLLRAAALERFLLACAATGCDLGFLEPHTRAPQPAAARQREPRPPLPAGWNDAPAIFIMPSPENIERQVRHCPVSRTLLAICLDFAVAPGFCTPEFWNVLHEIMHHLGDSIAKLMRRNSDRHKAFIQQQDRKHGSTWDWLRLKRDAIRERLGFFIGEPPVNPLAPAPATATGPP